MAGTTQCQQPWLGAGDLALEGQEQQPDGTLRLRADSSRCLEATTTKALDSPLLLTACAAQPSKAQSFTFGPASPASSTTTAIPWGQCFGPVNVRLTL